MTAIDEKRVSLNYGHHGSNKPDLVLDSEAQTSSSVEDPKLKDDDRTRQWKNPKINWGMGVGGK